MQPTERRFLADVIVKSIAGMFFASKASLGRYHVTKGLFKPLPAEVVIFATALIHHAIGEFATGIFKNERLEEGTLERMYTADVTLSYVRLELISLVTHRRITATWNAQSLQRQTVILSILRRRIVQQVGWEESEAIHQTDAVSNPFNDSLDDLQGLMEFNDKTVGPTEHNVSERVSRMKSLVLTRVRIILKEGRAFILNAEGSIKYCMMKRLVI